MKAATITAAALLLASNGTFTTARADSASASCEVREDGKVKKDASGTSRYVLGGSGGQKELKASATCARRASGTGKT